jgi:hypothetical protein
MANGLISASAPGTSLTAATGPDVTFSTKYPFHKLDSTNDVSFQVITLFFAKDPPIPDGNTVFYRRTLIYSFPHDYTYIPSTWFYISTDNFKTAVGSEGVYLAGGGGLATLDSIVLVIQADNTNVNIYTDVYWDNTSGALPAPTILGKFVAIRAYVFVNDCQGTDVPTHA